jgi:hypothetical protein
MPCPNEGIVQFFLRHPPRPLRPWLLVAETEHKQPTVRLQDRFLPLDVASTVAVVKDVEEAAVDHVVELLQPVIVSISSCPSQDHSTLGLPSLVLSR